ncbi:MAG: hypothetical protein RLZZ81_599 [Pseudomonadota bacterium]|jgi:hypothetical protein
MVEKFDKKKAEKIIENIKNDKINPFSLSPHSDEKAEKASKAYKEALKIEEEAKNAGETLSKDAQRRLNKIKTRYKKAVEERIKDIKNNKINPYSDAMKQGSKVDFMGRQVIAKNAAEGYKVALKIEQQAKEAGVSLDKDAMRRLEKIKSRYMAADKEAKLKKHQSDQAHKENKQKAEAFRSGATAAARKQRKEDYRTGGWGK